MNTLVIGASTNPERYSNKAIKKLIYYGHKVVAIGSKKGIVDTTEIYTEKIYRNDIHTITIYINPSIQPSYYEYIISLQPTRVIFNPGTENNIFYDLLLKHNIEPIEACTLVMLQTHQF